MHVMAAWHKRRAHGHGTAARCPAVVACQPTACCDRRLGGPRPAVRQPWPSVCGDMGAAPTTYVVVAGAGEGERDGERERKINREGRRYDMILGVGSCGCSCSHESQTLEGVEVKFYERLIGISKPVRLSPTAHAKRDPNAF